MALNDSRSATNQRRTIYIPGLETHLLVSTSAFPIANRIVSVVNNGLSIATLSLSVGNFIASVIRRVLSVEEQPVSVAISGSSIQKSALSVAEAASSVAGLAVSITRSIRFIAGRTHSFTEAAISAIQQALGTVWTTNFAAKGQSVSLKYSPRPQGRLLCDTRSGLRTFNSQVEDDLKSFPNIESCYFT
jgi:hypothetical protein